MTLEYKPSIRIGDSFRTRRSNAYGAQDLKIVKIEDDPAWNPNKGSKELNKWVYLELEKPVFGEKTVRVRFWWIKDECTRVFTKDERSFLLYAECCLVDGCGKLVGSKLNSEDIEAGKRFRDERLIDFGRIPLREVQHSIKKGIYNQLNVPLYWVRFSDKAWEIVHALRKERSARMIDKIENGERVKLTVSRPYLGLPKPKTSGKSDLRT